MKVIVEDINGKVLTDDDLKNMVIENEEYYKIMNAACERILAEKEEREKSYE